MIIFEQLFDDVVNRKQLNVIGNYDGGLLNESNTMDFSYGISPDISRLSDQADVFARTLFSKSYYWRRVFGFRDDSQAEVALYKLYIYSYVKALCSSLYYSSVPEGLTGSYVFYGHAIMFYLIVNGGSNSEATFTSVSKRIRLTDSEKRDIIEMIVRNFPFLEPALQVGHGDNYIISDSELDKLMKGLLNYEDSYAVDVRYVDRPTNNSSAQTTNKKKNNKNKVVNSSEDKKFPDAFQESERSPKGRMNTKDYLIVDLYDSRNYENVRISSNSPLGNAYLDTANGCWYYAYSSEHKISNHSYSFCKANFFYLKNKVCNLPDMFKEEFVNYYDKLPILLSPNKVDCSIKHEVYAITMVKPEYDPRRDSWLKSVANKSRRNNDYRPVFPDDNASGSDSSLNTPQTVGSPSDSDNSSTKKPPIISQFQRDLLKANPNINSKSTKKAKGVDTSIDLDFDVLDTIYDDYILKFYEDCSPDQQSKFKQRSFELATDIEIDVTDEVVLNTIKKRIVQGSSFFTPRYKYYINFDKKHAFVMDDAICVKWDPKINISYTQLMNILSKLILIYLLVVREEIITETFIVTINGVAVEYRLRVEKRCFIRLEMLAKASNKISFSLLGMKQPK